MKKIISFPSLLLILGILININCKKEEPLTRAVGATPPASTGTPLTTQVANPSRVYAGFDFLVEMPATDGTLSGFFTGDYSDIKKFSWALISGPSSVSFDNPSSTYTIVRGLEKGVYQFELTGSTNAIDFKDTVMVTVGKLSADPKEIIFNDLPIVCPWYCGVAIKNFYSQISQGTFFKVFFQRSFDPNWKEAWPAGNNTNSYHDFEYFIECRIPEGAGMYTYGSLYINWVDNMSGTGTSTVKILYD